MERQLTLLPAIDDKKVQKEVVSVLKEYRALKMRFSNEVEQEYNSLNHLMYCLRSNVYPLIVFMLFPSCSR